MKIHEYNEMMRHLTRREPSDEHLAAMPLYEQGGRVGYDNGGRIGKEKKTSVYKYPKKGRSGKILYYKSLDAFGTGASKEYLESINPFPEGSAKQKAFIKDLEKQFKYPLNSSAAKKAGVLGKEELAKKHNITFKQASLQTEKYKNKLNLKYPSPPYEGKEYKKIKQAERREFIKGVSVPKIERDIADLKAGTKNMDLAHRVSLRQMNQLKVPYLAQNLGIDAKAVNQGIVIPFEKKLDALYAQQNKLVKPYKGKTIPKEIQQQISDLNLKINNEVLKTKGALQGVLMNEKTGKYATMVGIDSKKVMGIGLIDKKVKDLTRADLDLMKLQIPEQLKLEKKNVAKILKNSGLPCALANGINCSDPRAYIKSINELKSKAALGNKSAMSTFRKVDNAMRGKFKGPLAGTGSGILGEIGFALPFAAMDYADGKSTAQIMNNASLGLFGMNAEEEAISYLPKGSLGGAIPSAMRAGERIEKLEDPSRVFPKGRMGMDENRFQKAQAKLIADAILDLTDKVSPFLEGPRNEFFNDAKAAKAYGELEIAKAKLKADELQRAKERAVTPFEGIEFKEGGRVSFKFGSMGRRGFLKLLAALGIGGATAGTGLIKLGSKAVGKKAAVKTGVDIATGTQGMPSWFPALVNKVIKEGDDVTEKLATMDRQVVHTKKLPDGEEVTVYRNLDSGDIRVDYDSIDNMGQEPVSLEYRKGEEIYDTGKGSLSTRKTTKEPDTFGASEVEPVGRAQGPDDYVIEWEGGDVGSVDDLISDTSKIKNYAEGKKPTLKEIVTRKRKTDETKFYNTSEGESQYIVNKQGEGDWDDYLPDIDDID